MARNVLDFQLSPVLGTDQKISPIARGANIKRDTVCMRARYKLSERRTLSYIEGDSWTGRISWMRDVHAILCLFVSYAIWTLHAFKIGINL
jgi:hypothetical protein